MNDSVFTHKLGELAQDYIAGICKVADEYGEDRDSTVANCLVTLSIISMTTSYKNLKFNS